MKTIIFVIGMALSFSAFAVEFSYLTEEQNAVYNGGDCPTTHEDFTEEQLELTNLAYSIEFCANLVKLRDDDYHRGWELHRMASLIVNSLPCDCPLHTHADNLAYGTYVDVAEILSEGTPISDGIEKFCDEVKVEITP